MSVGEVLRKAREEKKISQSEMARKLGINRSTWLRYETNDVKVPITRIRQIVDILEIDLEKII